MCTLKLDYHAFLAYITMWVYLCESILRMQNRLFLSRALDEVFYESSAVSQIKAAEQDGFICYK